jgi:hypothetical protein
VAGRAEQAAPLLARARLLPADDRLRTAVEQLRGLIAFSLGEVGSAYGILRTAAEEVASTDPVRALELLNLAGEAASLALDTDGAIALGSIAARLDVGSSPREQFLVHLLIGLSHLFADQPAGTADHLAAAVRTADALDDPLLVLAAARAAQYLGDDPAALRFSTAAAAQARAAGEVAYLPLIGPRLALAEIFAGRLTATEGTVTEVVELARATHLSGKTSHIAAVLWLALIAGIRGEEQRCSELVTEGLDMAAPRPMGLVTEAARWALGVLELGLGRADAALAQLRDLRQPVIVTFASLDRIETAHQVGDTEAARAWLTGLEATAACTRMP